MKRSSESGDCWRRIFYARNGRWICWASLSHIAQPKRALAEVIGIEAVHSNYSPDMEKHFLFGNDKTLKEHHLNDRLKA
ncbi:hypothetical protein [Oceanobacillus senegalensis]|uniref:hypothetical protein n=1 Tax=Oceanobacillus senegalensis TaxID=1936063 RepID=UPI000A30F821